MSATPAALVTGASTGIGRALAGTLARRGYAVTLVSRDTGGGLQQAAAELAAGGHDVVAAPADLRDAAAIEGVVAAHLDRCGRLDVVVHAAGVLAVGPIDRLGVDQLDEVLAVNLRAAALLQRATVGALRATAQGGGPALFVTLGSMAGVRGSANLAAYSASKFGVTGLSEALAGELAAGGVRVCAICPDRVATTPELAADPTLISLGDVQQVLTLLLDLSPAVSIPVIELRLAAGG